MAGIIWSGTTQVTATSGTETSFPIKVPYRGILRGYTLVQLTGAADGVTADLYSSNRSTAPNSTLPKEMFHVISVSDFADVVTDPDVVAIAENNNLNVAYQNRDGTPSVQQRFLYLNLTPAGSGAKNFAFTVVIEQPAIW